MINGSRGVGGSPTPLCIHLVLGLQRYQLANPTKGKRESQHFLFGDVKGQLAQVEDPGWDTLSTL